MNRQISSSRLGLTFTGCFLGAGYVSGREMWQFFGRYGAWGWIGLLLAMVCLGLLGGATLLLVQRTGDTALERLVIPWDVPALRVVVSIFSVFFLFGIDTIMTAGAGALFQQTLEIPHLWASLLFSIVIADFTLKGLEGMVSAFTVIVPFLTVSTVILSILALALLPSAQPPIESEGGQWLFSAVTFAAYNMFSSVAILAPLGKNVEKKHIWRGIAFGTALLLLIAGLILLVLRRNPAAVAAELPMLSVISHLSPFPGYIFALLLLLAMFGTAFSCFLAGVNQLAVLAVPLRVHRNISIFVLSALIWCASLFGFGKLIDIIYPVFGVFSVVFLLCMGAHLLYSLEKNNKP